MPPRLRAMAAKMSLVAIETMAVRKVSHSKSRISRQKRAAAAELGLVELRADVMVVEDVAHAERPERPGDEEDQVRRVAALQEVDAPLAAHPEGEPQLVPERRDILPQVAERAVAVRRHGVAVDVHALEHLVAQPRSPYPSG